MPQSALETALIRHMLAASSRVYKAGDATPLDKLAIPGMESVDLWVKREDLGPIKAYKWRGAFNAVSAAREADPHLHQIVTASAGNHAQGVALAASKLGVLAKIFMPCSTPMMKQRSVRHYGGDLVDIELVGDTFDQASDAARIFSKTHDAPYIHPYDDLTTIAGQATIAKEILESPHEFDMILVPIGGGGLAAGISNWLKCVDSRIKVIGVEGVDQASMKASFTAGNVITLPTVSGLCDGTAVKRVGDNTFQLCKDLLQQIVTVTDNEVKAAIKSYWDALRITPEPSGALTLAAVKKLFRESPDMVVGKRIAIICSGANMDFEKLGVISRQAVLGEHARGYLRVSMKEGSGNLLDLLNTYLHDVNVSGFQYGMTDRNVAHPVMALDAPSTVLNEIMDRLRQAGFPCEDVSDAADVTERIINYDPSLFQNPAICNVSFPERKGALREFMASVSDIANLCYFNYAYSGEQSGRAIMGFEFATPHAREEFMNRIHAMDVVSCRLVSDDVQERMLSHVGHTRSLHSAQPRVA